MSGTDHQTRKLVLLQMLYMVPGLPVGKWTHWALDSLFMDYFSFSEARSDLLKDQLVMESTRKNEKRHDGEGHALIRCDLTPAGETIRQQLLPHLPAHIRLYLTESAAQYQAEEKEKNSVLADYRINNMGAYTVHLSLVENNETIFSLSVQVSSEKQAKIICRLWNESTADIYKSILLLLNEEDSNPS